MILRDKNHTADEKKKCADLLTKYDVTMKEWQLGKTKVRLHDQHMFSHKYQYEKYALERSARVQRLCIRALPFSV